MDRRQQENLKIKFGARHFEALSEEPGAGVDFKDCVTVSDALAGL